MSTEPKIVKFIKHWRGYNPGEVAGFSAATAESLEKAKIAEPHDPGQDGKKPAQRQQTGTGRRATTKAPEGAQQTDAGTSTAQDADPSTTPPAMRPRPTRTPQQPAHSLAAPPTTTTAPKPWHGASRTPARRCSPRRTSPFGAATMPCCLRRRCLRTSSSPA